MDELELLNAAAQKGVKDVLPPIDTFPNQYPSEIYTHEITVSEFTSLCPKTGLPDLGKITVLYVADKWCMELKSLKLYFFAYRNLGIFYEVLVNRIVADIVRTCNPHFLEVTCQMTPRGGISSTLRRVVVRTPEMVPSR